MRTSTFRRSGREVEEPIRADEERSERARTADGSQDNHSNHCEVSLWGDVWSPELIQTPRHMWSDEMILYRYTSVYDPEFYRYYYREVYADDLSLEYSLCG